jgi:hypothetical protein
MCGKAYARAGFVPGGTNEAALQHAVDVYTGGFSNMKLLQNGTGASLGGQTARAIFAEGTGGKQLVDFQMLAVAKDGGWYALVFASPAVDYIGDAIKYFGSIKSTFRFTAPAPAHH